MNEAPDLDLMGFVPLFLGLAAALFALLTIWSWVAFRSLPEGADNRSPLKLISIGALSLFTLAGGSAWSGEFGHIERYHGLLVLAAFVGANVVILGIVVRNRLNLRRDILRDESVPDYQYEALGNVELTPRQLLQYGFHGVVFILAVSLAVWFTQPLPS